MSRAWFYLTLWHGTPEEFTTEATVKIQEAENASAHIKVTDTATSIIDKISSLTASIKSRDAILTEIADATEVVWHVG